MPLLFTADIIYQLYFYNVQLNLCKTATLKKTENDQLLLNAGQKYCRMLQREHSAILSTFVKLPFVIKFFVLSIFERRLYAGFTVLSNFVLFVCLI